MDRGFSSFTTFAYALYQAGPVPRSLPDISLRDHFNSDVNFSTWKGKYLLVDFMYLHCSSVCGILRSRLYEFYPHLREYLDNNLMFVSVSFDPGRDTPNILKSSWSSLGSHKSWVFTSMTGTYEEISTSLSHFGVERYPRGNGDFNHTAMYFMINPEGELVAVIDPSEGSSKNLEQIVEVISGGKYANLFN